MIPHAELEPGAIADGDPTARILALLESMDGRLSRLEGAVEGLQQATALAPAVVAGVTDTIDQHAAAARARGIDVDAHVQGSVKLAEALTRPEVVATLGRMVDRLDTVDAALQVAAQLPGMAAGAVDTVDGLIAAARAEGIDIDARLRASLTLVERMSAPETVEALLALTDRLDTAQEALAIADQLPGMAAGVIDTVDGLVAAARAQGIDIDARLRASLSLLSAATAPATLATLETLVAKLDQVAPMLEMLDAAPGAVAGVVDTFDRLAAELAARGIRIDERAGMLLAAAEKLTDPAIIGLLQKVLERGDDLSRLVDVLLESGIFEAAAVEVVGSTGKALVATRAAQPQPVGAFGAFRAMSDPDVQRAVGFGLQFARAFGKLLNQTN